MQPKYLQVENYIKNKIKRNELKIGDQIMTEEEMASFFNFSRMTINKALNHLVEEGYIERISGKGSFVKSNIPHISKSILSPSSFTEDMEEIGLKAGSKLISYEVIEAQKKPAIAAKLQLKEDDLIHYFVRLRYGNNTPIAISYTYISSNIIPAIDVTCLSNSFYEFLKSIGIYSSRVEWEFKAAIATPEQEQLLEISNSSLLIVNHLTYCAKNNKNIPFEYIETFYNSDLYSYKLQNDI